MKEAIKNGKIEENMPLRILYFLLGVACLGIGFLGIILPFIPGILFVIVSAFFFARSSRRFLRFILHNRLFGKYLHDYVHGPGLPFAAKLLIIIALLISLGFGCYYYVR
ncbi:MAG: DUF454 family protein [Ignavibacteria bacterium]|nr:DUF454 family protein [Ignavibacteria bacterium]